MKLNWKDITMNSKPAPKVYLKRDQSTVRTRINLTVADYKAFEEFKDRYEQRYGLRPSNSVLTSIALEALRKETRNGHLPSHPALYASE